MDLWMIKRKDTEGLQDKFKEGSNVRVILVQNHTGQKVHCHSTLS